MTLIKISVALLLLFGASAFADDKVLYVTHEPGRWHKYSDQLAVFRELAITAGWELNVASGSYDETLTFLATPDFGMGHDAIVYNFCFASSRDLDAMTNLIRQTTDNGIPAFLIHCSMHSWWDTFKKGVSIPGNEYGKARANKRLLKTWQKEHPDQSLPAWGDFTGIASTGHGWQKPIALTLLVENHPTTARIPDGYETAATELYNNHYISADTVALVRGAQGKSESVVMWLSPRGKSQIIGLTLGHADPEWEDPVFHMLLVDSINFLMGRSPPDRTTVEPNTAISTDH